MADLVDEAHGEERAGIDGVEAGGSANLGHAQGQLATGGEVGEDDVADEIEERIADLIAVAGLAGNVEFHHLSFLDANECCAFASSSHAGGGWDARYHTSDA
jgi:hypothetical protein